MERWIDQNEQEKSNINIGSDTATLTKNSTHFL